ncbi:MAG: bifunctional demethylmenaquinone methyltransferase/2-methoxy-6-polyprenyl-1,4-benzoquinol methylase UbiE [Pseudomonadota bacterium]
MNNNDKTHFGYKQVNAEDKASLVAGVFHSVADKYDVMNDLMSLGIHRVWKKLTVEHAAIRPGNKVLDIAGGTGDLAWKFSRLVGPTGRVYLADINSSMLNAGRERLLNRGNCENIQFVQADAQKLPFKENSLDRITISFGLRNVTDKDLALRSMYNALKPGGRLLVLEFSKPNNSLLSKVYDTYSFSVIPKVGQLVTGDADSYQYLSESIRMHPDQDTLQDMFKQAGFEQTKYHNMSGGIVALHSGLKT